ncbi:hypothetical protein ABG768_013045 [Culter alburnus]|uniref:Uncharacterized protein n=1 Tax=Culter alburnus TaxID=194366 RepID=A0AAW2B0S9_CULAL
MAMSTMPTYFPESADQSSSPELSDELTMAVAAGQETSSPVFSDASEKTAYSGLSDATLKTKKQWRQKKTQGAPVPDRSTQREPVPTLSQQKAPVPVHSDMGKLTSSLVFSDASEKVMHSGFLDASLKTREQQKKKQRQKKTQEAAAAAGSPPGAPVPAGNQQRGKHRIPEHLIKLLQNVSFDREHPCPLFPHKKHLCLPQGCSHVLHMENPCQTRFQIGKN